MNRFWLWFWPIVSRKFCYKETYCRFIYGELVYIYLVLSYTNVLHADIFSFFMIQGYIYGFHSTSKFYVDFLHN